MAPFRFSLENVARWKRQRMRQAEWEWARALADLRAVREQLAAMRRELGDLAAQMQGMLSGTRPGGWDGHRWHRCQSYCQHLREKLEEILRQEQEQDRVCQEKHRQLIKLKTEVEALDVLRQQAADAYAQRQQRQQQHDLDEFVLQRYGWPRR